MRFVAILLKITLYQSPHPDKCKGVSLVFLPIFALLFIACSTNQPQYVDSRDFVSFGLDNHDIDDIIKKQVDSLLKQKIFKNQSEAQILTISAIDNESGENIDIEIIANELTRHLSNSEKFIIVNAGRNTKIEQILRDSRKMRENAEYNQYTTIEEGNLIAPHYALTGKITKKNRKILDDEISEYVFSFTLTDLKLGAVRWVGTEQIAKKLPKSEVRNFSAAVANKGDSHKSESRNFGDSSVDSSFANNARDLGDSKASRNHYFIFGADFGAVSFGEIDFAPISASVGGQSYTIKPNIKFIFSSPSKDDSNNSKDEKHALMPFPLILRVGYLADLGRFGIALNALYSYAYAKIDSKGFMIRQNDANNTSASNINIDGKAHLQRYGGEITLYYAPFSDENRKNIYVFLGANILQDFASRLTLTLNTADSADELQITRKINALYASVRAEILWQFSEYVGFSYEMNYSFVANGKNAISSGFGVVVLGLQVRI